MSRRPSGSDLWRRFRRGGELKPLVCITATLAALFMLVGLGLGGGWLYGMTQPNLVPMTGRVGWVQPLHLRNGAFIGAAVWIVASIWLLRPAVRLNRHSLGAEQRRSWIGPITVTALIGAGVVIGSAMINRQPWDAPQWAVTSMSLVAGGAALVAWLPTVFGFEHDRPVLGPGGRVNVHCPECGYSMVGLRETVCPECGKTYTIDELILVQGYGPGGDDGEPGDVDAFED